MYEADTRPQFWQTKRVWVFGILFHEGRRVTWRKYISFGSNAYKTHRSDDESDLQYNRIYVLFLLWWLGKIHFKCHPEEPLGPE